MPLLTLKIFAAGLAYVALWLAFDADWEICRPEEHPVITKKHLEFFNLKNKK